MIDEVEQRIREQMIDEPLCAYNGNYQEILRKSDKQLFDQLWSDAWKDYDCSDEEDVAIRFGEACKEAVLENLGMVVLG